MCLLHYFCCFEKTFFENLDQNKTGQIIIYQNTNQICMECVNQNRYSLTVYDTLTFKSPCIQAYCKSSLSGAWMCFYQNPNLVKLV